MQSHKMVAFKILGNLASEQDKEWNHSPGLQERKFRLVQRSSCGRQKVPMMLQGVFKDYTSKDNSMFSSMEIQANVAEGQQEQTRNIYLSSNTKSKCKGDTSRDKLI